MRKILIIALSIGLTGCVYDPVYYGPPRHTHYHPHHYDYYYYPSVRVYFHFTTGYYYYYDRRRWIRSRTLPPHIHIDPRDRVRMRIESDKPYARHDSHREKYKPHKEYLLKKERHEKEREANRKWYRDYEKRKDKQKDKPKDRRTQY